jgi:GTP cyclohydrolase I
MITSRMLGVFKTDAALRGEFLGAIRLRRPREGGDP